MPVPNDVTVTRQVLAEPDAGLADRTWATLADGTPLVTAARRGKGMIVLFHVTADTRWSDLPLSGAFVDMLKRIVGLSGAVARPKPTPRPAPPTPATPCRRPACSTASARSGRRRRPRGRSPPTLHRPRHRRQSARLLRPAGRAARGQHAGAGRPAAAARLRPAQCARRTLPHQRAAGSARPDLPRRARAAADRRAGGVLARRRPLPADAAAAAWPPRSLVAASIAAVGLRARRHAGVRPDRRGEPTEFAAKATLETHLAYVVTGDAEVDAISKAGLQGLTLFLAQRTALEAGEPDRRRHRPRRTRLLPADLLADRAGRAEAVARRRSPASTPT